MVLNTVDIVLLAVAGYVAVVSLVRLMQYRHQQLLQDLASDLRRKQHQATSVSTDSRGDGDRRVA